MELPPGQSNQPPPKLAAEEKEEEMVRRLRKYLLTMYRELPDSDCAAELDRLINVMIAIPKSVKFIPLHLDLKTSALEQVMNENLAAKSDKS
jgi:hypothetical protein